MNTRFPIWRARSASAARLLLLAWALLAGAPAYAELPPPVAAALARQRVPESAVALWVQPLGGRGAVLSHQPDRAMNPASVMKLVTSFAAFDVLGPTHTWKTRVFADAVPQQGVVEGNLYIVGEGDPAFSLERLWRLLRGLRAQGVGEVRGNLVLDRSAWPLPAFDPMAFDGRGHRPYNTGADALLMNFAALKLSFVPGGDGHPPRLLSDPPLAGVAVVSALHLGRGACGDWDERLAIEVLQPAEQQTVIRVSGEWRDACGPRDWLVTPLAPDAYARALVAALWRELGGSLGGTVVDGVAPAELPLLALETSPSLAEVARDMNKWSNNVQARHLLASLGQAAGGQPDVIAAGTRVVRDRLMAAGIGTTGLVLENGAGLSRSESISVRTLGRMLELAYHAPWMPEYLASLSIAGFDGTTRRRLAGSPARGFAHVKTGSLNGARSIAGYVLDRHGQRYAVAMLVNDPQAWATAEAQDALLEWVWNGAGAELAAPPPR